MEKSEETLKEEIEEFISERLNASYTKIISNDKYQDLANRRSSLLYKIEHIINDETLADQYKKAELDMYDMQLQEAYKTGFLDSTKIFVKGI